MSNCTKVAELMHSSLSTTFFLEFLTYPGIYLNEACESTEPLLFVLNEFGCKFSIFAPEFSCVFILKIVRSSK